MTNRQIRIEDQEQSRQLRETVRSILRVSTEQGCKSLNMSGISFVMIGIATWYEELFELDHKAACDFFKGLADANDKRLSDKRRKRGEERRRAAWLALVTRAQALQNEWNERQAQEALNETNGSVN